MDPCVYTGSAGTGKSIVLRELVLSLHLKYGASRVGVTASTGSAACNIGGQTIHRFFVHWLGHWKAPSNCPRESKRILPI